MHVDLLTVKSGEKVTVEVSVETEGDLAPGSFLVENVLNTLSVETEATHIPTSVTVSIAGLEGGDAIHAKDVTLPAGTTLVTDPDAVVIQILAAQAEEPSARPRPRAPRPEPYLLDGVAGHCGPPPRF